MTPDEVATYARQRYNAVSNTRFFTAAELYTLLYDAQMQLARESFCIRDTYETTTVVDQQEYSFPTATLAIKRVTYDGYEVVPRPLKEVLDLTAGSATASGSPQWYAIWDETLYLAPVPAEAVTLKIFSVNEPSTVSSTSVLDVPTRYHLDLAEYLLAQMATKDKNYQGAAVHLERWQKALRDAKAFERKALRGQELTFVRDADGDVDTWTRIR